MSQKKSFVVAASVLLLSSLQFSCASRPRVASGEGTGSPVIPERATLPESIQGDLTGLDLESAELRDRLRQDAREFIQIRGSKAASATRKKRVQACQEDEPRDAYDATFCRLIIKSVTPRSRNSKSRATIQARQRRLTQIIRALKTANLDDLADVTEGEAIDSLKKVSGDEPVRPLIQKVLASDSCVSTALLTGLGLKTEEFFPDPSYRNLAMSLYQKSSDCGTDAPAVKATYRLGLIQIWDQKYKEAEASFAKITDNPEAADFRSRVLYWRYFAAKQTGNSGLQEKMKATLSKDHHMSLHGLITAGTNVSDTAPRVFFRSATQPQLNATVRVAEALQAEGARDSAADALTPILEAVRTAEPEFQLYVGLLFMRSGDTIGKFKLLAGLFRDYPMMISKESLELMFPLQRFEVVRSYEEKADPYLVISLIRQESAFNERARSRVGALGLMQLMPQTARRMERVTKHALLNPQTNIRLGVRFFSHLTNRYQGATEMALAAYNAGPEKVDTWMNRYPVDNRLLFVDLIPFRETREYVASIARNYYWYRRLYGTEMAVAGRVPSSSSEKTNEKIAAFKLFD